MPVHPVAARLRAFYEEYRHAWPLLIFGLLALLFYHLEEVLVPRYWMVSALDAHIPFLPIFVVPYLTWFGFIAWGLWRLFKGDRATFLPTCLLLCAGMGAALVLFVLFPNGQPLRPQTVGEGPFAWLVANLIYANDTNTNCCPSLHVLNQLAVCIGLCRSKLYRDRPGMRLWLWGLTVLVCASTVFIKQHSIVDVVVALCLEWPLCRLFFPSAQRTRQRSRSVAAEY